VVSTTGRNPNVEQGILNVEVSEIPHSKFLVGYSVFAFWISWLAVSRSPHDESFVRLTAHAFLLPAGAKRKQPHRSRTTPYSPLTKILLTAPFDNPKLAENPSLPSPRACDHILFPRYHSDAGLLPAEEIGLQDKIAFPE